MFKGNKYVFKDILIGQTESFERTITDKEMRQFLEISHDTNPLHNDFEYAKQTPFKKLVIYGMLSSILHSTLAGVYLPGKYCTLISEKSNFINPAFPGDTLKIIGTVTDKKEFGKLIYIKTRISCKEKIIVKGEIVASLLR